MLKSEDLKDYYRITIDDRSLNYGNYISSGKILDYKIEEYNSHNTDRLKINEMKELLMKLPEIRKDLL